ncbi:MAG: protein kinase [Planctomycetota bacterium]
MAPDANAADTTLLFCRSTAEGSIEPLIDLVVEDEPGDFILGALVADRYRLLRQLGRGAMGQVFLARDHRLDRDVAMKVAPPLLDRRPELEALLHREARLGASLDHPGIAVVYDFRFSGNRSFTVFELVEGENLRAVLRRRGTLPLAEVADLIGELASTLDYAHAHGVVHRDLKPENISLAAGGQLKILDLGLAMSARYALPGEGYFGTPAYSAPEQAIGRITNGRADQYALAVIAYEMLTGQRPFVASDQMEMLDLHANHDPPLLRELAPGIPDFAERGVLRALSKAPEERFATCREFAVELAGSSPPPEQPRLPATDQEQRIGFFIGHASQDSLLARQLAAALERHGMRCWFYGRDATPGATLFSQARKSMDRSQAFLALVSRAALASPDFSRELAYAVSRNRPILPVLVDLSREEFESAAPDTVRLLGASPTLELRLSGSLQEVADRLAQGAASLGVT